VLVNYAQTLRLTWSGTEFKILTDLQTYGSLVTRRLGNVRTKESPAVSSRLGRDRERRPGVRPNFN